MSEYYHFSSGNSIPSYRSFFPRAVLDTRSIRDIHGSEIPKADGVIGGPPCQSWSTAGCRKGIDDPRGQLFYDYIRVVHHIKPLFFVAENVSGLIQGKNREFFQQILRMMQEEGYTVTWKLVNAHPQDRLRVLMVGYHHSLNKQFVFPDPLSFRPTLRDAIFDLRKLKIGKNRKVTNHDLFVSGYSPRYMSSNRVRPWHKPSLTIMASSGHTPLHPKAPRMILTGQGMRRQFARSLSPFDRTGMRAHPDFPRSLSFPLPACQVRLPDGGECGSCGVGLPHCQSHSGRPGRESVMNSKNTFTFIDLFAGIGGMRKGFEDIGGKCVFTSERDIYAQTTYRANYSCVDHRIRRDITTIHSKEIPSHDVLLAGFPCQPFSLAGMASRRFHGKASGFYCPKQGSLFFEIVRILGFHRPKAFLLENVKNIVTHNMADHPSNP